MSLSLLIKYNIGDIVFFMKNNEVTSGMVTSVKTVTSRKGHSNLVTTSIEYVGVGEFTINDNNAFKSKEDLLNSL